MSTRVDKWLWAVRLYKTRSAATDACRAGHVRVNKLAAKPATAIRPGDTVEARSAERDHVVEVTAVIEKRVGAPLASSCYIDHSPPPPSKEEKGLLNFVRDRGTGRPTKRDRRQLDQARKQ
ncbi:MAG TPA: RNA-binding S4 domain-containing protein [Acidimicrobiales bacterium]|nr:RNA-binding S4 domain-containing protein [Acidimicrobiales bacterium]